MEYNYKVQSTYSENNNQNNNIMNYVNKRYKGCIKEIIIFTINL